GGGQRLVHVVALESGDGDAELLGHDRTRVRARAAQFGEPLGRVLHQLLELGVGYRAGLELLRRGGQVDAELLGRGLRLHRSGGRLTCGLFIHVPNGSITPMLRLSFVTGTEPDKWFARFRDRTPHRFVTADSADPLGELLDDRADLALVRLPDARLTEEHHVVVLYPEATGIAVPKDHELTLLDTVTPEDIEGEIINWSTPDSGEVDVE